MQEVVVATGNAGKLRELNELLEPLGWRVRPQGDFGVEGAEETGLTFVENAILKARHAARATGLPALADDSGLAVAALGGAPGIYSSRYAGADATDADNLDKLLDALADTPEERREAFFHCSLVLLRGAEDPCPVIAEGRWPGRIAQAPAGAGGFGYDPVFFVPERGVTAAELDPAEKSRLSHRGRAMQALRRRLEEEARG
ncbi:nucleoside-triphosphate diphosphatase [Thiohalorhabdus denitrificans]|uniref:dITP/XTP pyrophosphatase n=1 Tax=Thiohalorhabdus denitrificans TaxID=381306 RepID=A0A0P9C2C6_9GAMM|nr:RdgB/HAM1 family non-canonical purine NTP pyrophosphatase [Thiohalorhabdus denitrificans]KPV39102.1 nucleoside-triphosphate diphosphatase [Thiohalorhabdus denitrificans]SCX77618.1 XTP/dITP diphosphohydrolase [Thiohalorhabdus denitrificans]